MSEVFRQENRKALYFFPRRQLRLATTTIPTDEFSTHRCIMDSDIGRFKRAVPQIKPVLIEGGEYFTAERKYTEPRGPIQCCTRKKPAIPRVCPFCGNNRHKAEPKENSRSVKRALPVKTLKPQKWSFFRVSKLRESKGKPLPLSRQSVPLSQQSDDERKSSNDAIAAWTAEVIKTKRISQAILARERKRSVPEREDTTFTQLLADAC